MTRWIEEIVAAMAALGGAARYSDLYEMIEQTTDRHLTKEWRATVRRTIEDHSSDSANFRAEDVFQHLSHGHWKLRGVEVSQEEIAARDKLTPTEVMARVFVREHWRRFPDEGTTNVEIILSTGQFVVKRATLDGKYVEFEFANQFVARAPKEWFPKLVSLKGSSRQPSGIEAGKVTWLDGRLSLSVAQFFGAIVANAKKCL